MLTNQLGMKVCLLNFGARISSIKLPINGQLQEMVVTYSDTQDYLTDEYYLGATCGPIANRLSKAEFVIDDNLYKVFANEGDNCLHGGENNFSNSFWEIDRESQSDNYVKFLLNLVDLENGFPGNRLITVEYRLNDNNQLKVFYTGVTDKKTPINMTNHVYFSLGQASCLSLDLFLESTSFIERNDNGIPTGEIKNTSSLGVNLEKESTIKDLVANCTYPQVCHDAGIDHCFVLDKSSFENPKAILCSSANGVKLKVYTDQPTVQVYTGNYLAKPFIKHAGVCLECHDFVDAPNQPNFSDITYSSSKVYQSEIIYEFEIESH